jgi:hypothetical protein
MLDWPKCSLARQIKPHGNGHNLTFGTGIGSAFYDGVPCPICLAPEIRGKDANIARRIESAAKGIELAEMG